MEKLDLKKGLKHLYQPSAKEVTQVDVPAMNYLMVDGEGDSNTAKQHAAMGFQEGWGIALGQLLAYARKAHL